MAQKVNITINPEIILPVYRDDLFNYDYRYGIFWGGRASGKTVYLITKLLVKGLQEKRNILLMTKQTNRIKDSVWRELLDAISTFGLNEYFELNRSEFRAIFKLNQTQFRCIGLDEPEKIKGYSNISDVLMDEATSFTRDDFVLIDGTVRSKKYNLPLQCYLSFNPVSKQNWVFKYWGFDVKIVPPNTKIVHTTYLDNPFLDSSYRERMEQLKERDPVRYKIEADGEFATLDKLVYNNWKVEDFDHSKIKGLLICGLDFGYINDKTAFIASILDEPNKKIYVFKEWGDIGKINPEIAKIITSMGFSKSVIIADSAEQKSIEELKRAGLIRIRPSKKGPNSIIYGIQQLKQYEIIVHPKCEETIIELQNYSWEKDKISGEYINYPCDNWNHYLDALRYSLQCNDEPRLKTMSKDLWGL